MNTSIVIEQPAHIASLDVKCKEKLKIAGSFRLADETSNDSSIPFGLKCPSVNSGAHSIADSPSRERIAQRISHRKKTNKGKPTKIFYYKAISETRPGRCDQDYRVASYQPFKEERNIATFNRDRNLKSFPSSAVVSSLSASGNMGYFSKDSSARNGWKCFECSYDEMSDISGSHLLSDTWNNRIFESSKCCKGLNRSKQWLEELTCNCCAEDLQENLYLGQSSQCKSCGSIDILSCGFEDCSNCINENTKIKSKCSTATNFHAVAPGDDFKSSTLTSQCEAVHKSLKNVCEAWNYGENRLNPFHMGMDSSLRQKKLWLKRNSISSERWSPSLLVSSSVHNNALDGIKEKFKYRKVPGNVLVEPSHFVAHQRFSDSLYPHVSRSSQVSIRQIWEFEKFNRKANHLVKNMNYNNCKKGLGDFNVNLSRLRNKQFFSQKEPFEWINHKNCYAAQGAIHNSHNVMSSSSHSLHTSIDSSVHLFERAQGLTKSSVTGQGILNWIPPQYTWMKIPRIEHVVGRSLLASVEYETMNFERSISGCPYENIERNVNSQMIQRKWVPVRRKEPGMMENTGSLGVYNDHNVSSSFSTKVENISYLKDKNVLVPSALSAAAEDISLTSSHKVTSVKREVPQFESVGTEIKAQEVEIAKDSVAYGDEPKDALTLLRDPHTQALNAAYRLQLASESVELASGCPLAEFERFLHSATPLIAPFLYEKCDICLDNQLFHSSLCKHQRPNLSLGAVWNWYQKPGSYGLEVKAETENSKGLFTDPITFYAYFVPSLSAVQLFGYTSISNCRNTCLINPKVKYKEFGLQSHSSETLDISPPKAIKETHFQEDKMENFICNGNDSLSLTSIPFFSDDAELVFEYFESEQPQQRKPLCNKIVDLVNGGTSSHPPFGDSSMLKGMMLHDLHPASWFSVAWYPIYRVPESSFRASFLTYHSLGYLVQRCIPTDSLSDHIFSVVCPVLGLQSYNAQGEVWFDPKMPVESSAEESKTFKHSEILKDRLKILEKNALLFSRGCVCKDHVKVVNRHPDYEFFTSRKR
ncbi:uncharacterized protein LOC132308039 [Cornus florida]|uniref:uncharacterized protein LOC132308039 n=1 Tax=Cornus florida TaxID=4283 RepID=UPI00289D839A|nr:uncharacterized protein LOC132308039 [Cornus florida]